MRHYIVSILLVRTRVCCWASMRYYIVSQDYTISAYVVGPQCVIIILSLSHNTVLLVHVLLGLNTVLLYFLARLCY